MAQHDLDKVGLAPWISPRPLQILVESMTSRRMSAAHGVVSPACDLQCKSIVRNRFRGVHGRADKTAAMSWTQRADRRGKVAIQTACGQNRSRLDLVILRDSIAAQGRFFGPGLTGPRAHLLPITLPAKAEA